MRLENDGSVLLVEDIAEESSTLEYKPVDKKCLLNEKQLLVRRSLDFVKKPFEKIREVLDRFVVTDDQLQRIMQILLEEMEIGLNSSAATLKMLPSFVRALPDGTETGHYLALDLGGTNFRVLLIKLAGNESTMKSKIYHVPSDLMVGEGMALFDHIASCLSLFTKEVGLSGQKLSLGFTFSFPCAQHGLTNGRLIKWTKGFKCSGVEGRDVVRLLQEAVHRRRDVDIDVVALLNDTVGTLMSLAYTDQDCQVGVIVGTGTNACYVEKLSKCQKLLENQVGTLDENMIINMEWGALGDNGQLEFIRNNFDRSVDENSINSGQYLFEKAISGMYMGELVRLTLKDMNERGLLFEGKLYDIFCTPNSFPTKYVSEIERDTLNGDTSYCGTVNVLTELGVSNVSQTDCSTVANVCSVISRRAAYLCASGIAALINRIGKPYVTVGMDGSVYRFHPSFKHLLKDKIAQLIQPNLQFDLKLSEDGSGRGAALVAAVACRLEKKNGFR